MPETLADVDAALHDARVPDADGLGALTIVGRIHWLVNALAASERAHEETKRRLDMAYLLFKVAPGPSADGYYSAEWHTRRLDWMEAYEASQQAALAPKEE